MAISVVQRDKNQDLTGSGVSKAFGSNNTGGNKLIVLAAISNSSITLSTPTDTRGNTYAVVATELDAGSFYGWRCWVVESCAAGANTVTVNNTSFSNSLLFIYEVSGLAATSSFDKKVTTKSDSGSSPTSGSITVTNSNELILGVGLNSSSAAVVFASGSGYSNLQQPGNSNGLNGALEEKIISGGGSNSATFTLTTNNGLTMTTLLSFSDTTIVNSIPNRQYIMRQAVKRASYY